MVNTRHNLVVKIGTAALGAADGMPDAKLLGGLVDELAALKHAGHQVILVSSGAVGTGRAMVKQHRLTLPLREGRSAKPIGEGYINFDPSPAKAKDLLRKSKLSLPLPQGERGLVGCDPVAERQILASLGQAKLLALYQDLLTRHRLLASQILLTKQDFHTREHHKHMARLFDALQKQPHILPIVNENDSVTANELMFTDNDELAGLLASMINADRLIILSHIAGVYDRAPDEADAKIIPLIDWSHRKNAPDAKGKSRGGRGGMASKLAVARKMADFGIRTHIAAAREPNIIARLLQGEQVGTSVAPLPRKRNAVKRWLANDINKAPASVAANQGLADMIRDPKQAISLLPVGLTKIAGSFNKGDLVQITDEKGETLALGVARYDAAALRHALGKKRQPVFIHYDQLHRVDYD